MKVIQVTDEDCRQLLQDLRLEKLDPRQHWGSVQDERTSAHRAFHYVVTSWLQKHGASLAGKT